MLMRHVHPKLQFNHTLPYGAIVHEGGIQFVIFSRSATEMRLLLYDRVEDTEPSEVIHFERKTDRWGDIWSIFVNGLNKGQLYHIQADGPHDPENGQWFDGDCRLIDPYTKALAGEFQPHTDGIIRPPKCVVIDDAFDWEGDRHLRLDYSETIIYEMHVRGFTMNANSGVKHPGTYLGVIEKIPYLKSLGITAVELMPIHEFPIRDILGQIPERGNYWGYDSMAFFSPHRGYASGSEPGCQVTEFKEMVKALHQAGIEVILDVVFNHTCEGNERGPVLSFKGLENRVYYILENSGSRYANYSGCGNTVNGNHPIVREMIFHCLRHWVHNYHIDGFRFDLASILSRDRSGALISRRLPKTRCWRIPRSSRKHGMPLAPIRSARSVIFAGEICDKRGIGRSGMDGFAMTYAVFGGAIRGRWELLRRGSQALVTCMRAPAVHPTVVSILSRRTTGSLSTTWSPTERSTTRKMAKGIEMERTTT